MIKKQKAKNEMVYQYVFLIPNYAIYIDITCLRSYSELRALSSEL